MDMISLVDFLSLILCTSFYMFLLVSTITHIEQFPDQLLSRINSATYQNFPFIYYAFAFSMTFAKSGSLQAPSNSL